MQDKTWLLWGHLSKFGKSRVIRSSYFWIIFVPIAAKSLENAPDRFEIYGFIFTLSLPFSWIIFYLAACAFALATLMFSWKCPPLIRDHRDWTSLENTGRTVTQMLADFSNWLRNGGIIYTAEGDRVEHFEAVNEISSKYCTSHHMLTYDSEKVHKTAKNLSIRLGSGPDIFWHIRGLMQAE